MVAAILGLGQSAIAVKTVAGVAEAANRIQGMVIDLRAKSTFAANGDQDIQIAFSAVATPVIITHSLALARFKQGPTVKQQQGIAVRKTKAIPKNGLTV